MDGLFTKVILGWARHFIGMGAAALVAKGYLDGSQGDQLTGALVALVPLAFSAYDKLHAMRAKQTAVASAVAEDPPH